MQVVMTIGAIIGAKLQSSCYHHQTNTQRSIGWMPFLSPNRLLIDLSHKLQPEAGNCASSCVCRLNSINITHLSGGQKVP